MKQQRALGAWMGLAVGNALGAPLESLWQNQIQIKLGHVSNMIGGGWLDLRPGEPSADAAFAAAVAQVLIEHGCFEPAAAAKAYTAILKDGRHDISAVLRASLSLIEEGLPVAEAAAEACDLVREDNATAEVLARAVPHALRPGMGVEEILHSACADARLTHARSDAAAGAGAVAALVWAALEAESFAEAFERADAALEATSEEIENLLVPPDELRASQLAPVEPDAAHALEVVLFELARGRKFEPTLIHTVNLGGCSDVTGAVTGAIAGALAGEEKIPGPWIRSLVGRRAWRRLGEALVGAPPPAAPADRKE